MTRTMAGVVGAAVLALSGCGGDGGGTGGTGGTCTPGTAATVTLSSTGASPKAVCVVPAGRVTFNNTDTVAHGVEFDAACGVAAVPSIAAGATGSATFPTAKVCSFHDTAAPTNVAFQGTVAVSDIVVGGPGY